MSIEDEWGDWVRKPADNPLEEWNRTHLLIDEVRRLRRALQEIEDMHGWAGKICPSCKSPIGLAANMHATAHDAISERLAHNPPGETEP